MSHHDGKSHISKNNSNHMGDTIHSDKKENIMVKTGCQLINNTRITKESFMEIPFWFQSEKLLHEFYDTDVMIELIKEFLWSIYQNVIFLL